MKPFLTLRNITVRLRDKFLFENTSWVMNEGENWVIVGPNGSGKTTLVKAIAGLLPLKQGEIILDFLGKVKNPYPLLNKNKIAYISFESHQYIINKSNDEKDFQEFSGKKIKGISVKEYLKTEKSSTIFEIKDLLNRDIATLSSGEIRKVLVIKALLKSPRLLILDEPFDGLDKNSKKTLMNLIESLEKNIHLFLVTHRANEVPKNITHVMVVKNGNIESVGLRKDMDSLKNILFEEKNKTMIENSKTDKKSKKILLRLKNVNVKISGKQILKNFNWIVKEGENWAVLGPNGSGKTTLVKLITADHPQTYSNDIKIFGKGIGGELSIWDIRQKIGLVSDNLLLKHDKSLTGLEVILSGFFDSVGLYRNPSKKQKEQALVWINKIGIDELVDKKYDQLSFGQKKIIVIARAIVKNPKLLILDEPCHGLDFENRKRVLKIIEKIAQGSTNIIYITHNEDELIPSITHKLVLNKGQIIV